MTTNTEAIKVSLNLSAYELAQLNALAARRNTTPAQVIREALTTEKFLQDQMDDGAMIMTTRGRRTEEIVFPQMSQR